MIIKHIKDKSNVDDIDKYVNDGKHVFVLVYMVGCGPCNATRPEWAKLEGALKDQYANKDDVAIIDVDQELISGVNSLGSVEGFPTMKYIKGDKVESYEDSGIKNTNRSVDSFINWIESKITDTVANDKISSPHHVAKRLSKSRSKSRSQKGGKRRRHWTKKYKKSINCKRPKGFSQKQYCKYGRNK
jgi:hypothetical protein